MILLTAGAFSAIVLCIPMMMLILVHSKRVIGWRRRYVSYVSGLYFDYAAALIYYIGGTKIHIYSECDTEILKKDKNALIICNHRSRVDWMFAGWSYGAYLKLNSNLRIILKESLRSIPVYGWAMQIMMYIFLSRKRDQDVPHIIRTLTYLLCTGPVPSVFLYPEGTDLSEGNKRKSNAYAREKNLPELEYVLYPKPSGFQCCLTTLKEKQDRINRNINHVKIDNRSTFGSNGSNFGSDGSTFGSNEGNFGSDGSSYSGDIDNNVISANTNTREHKDLPTDINHTYLPESKDGTIVNKHNIILQKNEKNEKNEKIQKMKLDSSKLLSKSKEKQNKFDSKTCSDNNVFFDDYDDIQAITSEEIKLKNKKNYLNDNKDELKIITELVNNSRKSHFNLNNDTSKLDMFKSPDELLLELPDRIYRAFNAGNLKLLKNIIDRSLAKDCTFQTMLMNAPLYGRDYVYKCFEAYITSHPDLIMISKAAKIVHDNDGKCIQYKFYWTGTHVFPNKANKFYYEKNENLTKYLDVTRLEKKEISAIKELAVRVEATDTPYASVGRGIGRWGINSDNLISDFRIHWRILYIHAPDNDN